MTLAVVTLYADRDAAEEILRHKFIQLHLHPQGHISPPMIMRRRELPELIVPLIPTISSAGYIHLNGDGRTHSIRVHLDLVTERCGHPEVVPFHIMGSVIPFDIDGMPSAVAIQHVDGCCGHECHLDQRAQQELARLRLGTACSLSQCVGEHEKASNLPNHTCVAFMRSEDLEASM